MSIFISGFSKKAPYYKNLAVEEYWTAGSDVGCEGKFTWCPMGSSAFSTSELNWDSGSPNQIGDCLYIKTLNNQTLFANGHCDQEKHFLCEAETKTNSTESSQQRDCSIALSLNGIFCKILITFLII